MTCHSNERANNAGSVTISHETGPAAFHTQVKDLREGAAPGQPCAGDDDRGVATATGAETNEGCAAFWAY